MGGKACLLELIADHPKTPVVMLTEHAQAEAWCEQLSTLPELPELPRCGQ